MRSRRDPAVIAPWGGSRILDSPGKGHMMLPTTDWESMKLFMEPHWEMLAQDRKARTSSERPDTERRSHPHLRARHPHRIHLSLHSAHG